MWKSFSFYKREYWGLERIRDPQDKSHRGAQRKCELLMNSMGFPGGLDGKVSACSVGDLEFILGWEGPLEEGMETHSSIIVWRVPMDRGAWWTIGVTKSQTWLSN